MKINSSTISWIVCIVIASLLVGVAYLPERGQTICGAILVFILIMAVLRFFLMIIGED